MTPTRTTPSGTSADRSAMLGNATSGCMLVGWRRSPDPPPCPKELGQTAYVERPVFSAIIQSFKDPVQQAAQLTQRLRAIPIPKEIIVNDDAHGATSGAWLPLLKGPNEFYISSPDLHEVRAYNRLAQMARGELLVFVQGDCCLPRSSTWMLDAAGLFQQLPRLAMLSARAGFDEVLNWQLTSEYRDARTWGAAPYKALDHAVRVPRNGSAGSETVPFVFAPGVDNGPLLYRRNALLAIGGFDQSYSCAAGHLSGHYDFEASLRFWVHGWQVGVFYGGPVNGIGGRKTSRNPARKRERHSNELWNGKRVEALWRAHNATITRRLAESRRDEPLVWLTPAQRLAMRDAAEARLGKLSKQRCYEGVARPRVAGPKEPRRDGAAHSHSAVYSHG